MVAKIQEAGSSKQRLRDRRFVADPITPYLWSEIYNHRIMAELMSSAYANTVLAAKEKYWGFYAYLDKENILRFKTVTRDEVYYHSPDRAFLPINTE